MTRLLHRLLLAARVISDGGRWPGQRHIRGAASAPRARGAALPLRWPGQAGIDRATPRPRPAPTARWDLATLLDALAPRRAATRGVTIAGGATLR